jgi:hypothetical protein
VRREGRERVGRVPTRDREKCKLVAFNLTAKEIRSGYLNGTDHERGRRRGTESVLKRKIPVSVQNGDIS